MGEGSPLHGKNGQTSLRDVGVLAGVSFQTVSKVLAGKGSVSPATRARVLAAAAQLGYVPNTLARGLATQRTMSIGFLTSGLASFVFAPMLLGAEREARRHGYFTLFNFVDNTVDSAIHVLQQQIERRVDGVVSAALAASGNDVYGALLRSNVPSVATHSVAGGGVPVIGEDAEAPGYLAAEHLAQLGHRQIAIIPGVLTGERSGGRLTGNIKAMEAAGISYDRDLVEPGSWSIECGFTAMTKLLDRGRPFTAVIAHNDHMAMGAIRALHMRGLRVPEDVSIVGCDNLDFARFTNPPLTTVNISFESTGVIAVRTLLDRINGEFTVPERIVLPCSIVVRESTSPART
jgi:LacI family transcriptional regulator